MNRSTVVSNGCGSKGPTQALAEGINRMDEVPRFALLILYRERAVWKLQIDRTLYKRRSSQLSKQPNQSWRWRLRCGAGLGHAHTQNTLKPFQLCIEQAEIGWQQAARAPDTHIPPMTHTCAHTQSKLTSLWTLWSITLGLISDHSSIAEARSIYLWELQVTHVAPQPDSDSLIRISERSRKFNHMTNAGRLSGRVWGKIPF